MQINDSANIGKILLATAAAMMVASFLGCDQTTPNGSIYEQHCYIDDAGIIGLISECPTDKEGPYNLQFLDSPQVSVRFELGKIMSIASNTCVVEYLEKYCNLDQIETDTFIGDYGPELSDPVTGSSGSDSTETGSGSTGG